METQLVISTVSEKYGHVSSLGIGASLFIFITTTPHHFSLSYYAFVFVTRLSPRARYAVGWRSTATERGRKNTAFFHVVMLSNDSGRTLLNRAPNPHQECLFL